MNPVGNIVRDLEDRNLQGGDTGAADMPIAVGSAYDGKGTHTVMISRWTPSEAERKAIAEGGDIWLWVCGRQHPPVSVTGEQPIATEVQVPQTRITLPCGIAADEPTEESA